MLSEGESFEGHVATARVGRLWAATQALDRLPLARSQKDRCRYSTGECELLATSHGIFLK